jgi:hypothetical protein
MKQTNLKPAPEFSMTRAELEQLGRGEVAYVRPIGSAEARSLMGEEAPVADGGHYFCLHMADGTPVSISSTQEAAIANAMVNDLTPLRLN